MPTKETDYLRIKSEHLTVGDRKLKAGEVIPVELVSRGVAEMLVDAKRAEWAAAPKTGD